MGSSDPGDLARMSAQALVIEAYERVRWPRRTLALPDLLKYLMDQHGLTGRPRAASGHCESRQRSVEW